MEQIFRCGEREEPLEVRPPEAQCNQWYNQLDDIQDAFPGAHRFRVGGRGILFLQDENGKRYVPLRIAYYPDQVVEIILAADNTLITRTASMHNIATTYPPTATTIPDQHRNTALVHKPLTKTLSPTQMEKGNADPTYNDRSAYDTVITHGTNALASSVALNQAQTENDDQGPNLLYTLASLAPQFMGLKSQQSQLMQAISEVKDQLVFIRQRADASLIQNYELHEYPIPRFFVILPVAEASDPLRFTDKFRLHFLCECGEHSKADSDESNGPIENAVHLALHNGYELQNPTAAFETFGSTVLPMLRLLQASLIAMSILEPTAKSHTKGVRSDTLAPEVNEIVQGVDYAIKYLEKLQNNARGVAESTTSTAVDDKNVGNVRALEGADLRKLYKFLKVIDKHEAFGNLYRITTMEGHVKWVCLRHSRPSHREAAMKKFLDIIRLNNGKYDEELWKVTIQLNSEAAARAFFSQLEQAPAVKKIDVQFKWEFSPSDLKQMMQSIQRSSIRYLALDLNESNKSLAFTELWGSDRYEPIIKVLSTPKIESFHLSGLYSFGTRSSTLAKGISCPALTTFGYTSAICSADQTLLANILQACPKLTVLQLGNIDVISDIHQELTDAIVELLNLEVLHLFSCHGKSGRVENFFSRFPTNRKLRELVLVGGKYEPQELYKCIRTMAPWLERMVIDMEWSSFLTGIDFGQLSLWTHNPNPNNRAATPFKQLFHLGVDMVGAISSDVQRSFTTMRLTHLSLRCRLQAWAVLNHVNYSFLRHLQLKNVYDKDLIPFWGLLEAEGNSIQIDTLSLCPREDLPSGVASLSLIALRHLWISGSRISENWLRTVFKSLNVSRLEILGYGYYNTIAADVVFRDLKGWRENAAPQLKVHIVSSANPGTLLPNEVGRVVQHQESESAVCYKLLGFHCN
ncbi:hypothetical protein MVEG_02458 [Podila verticillata NRRL 6337]|nr:hypothetical protein MVEG_02458 [Podila verticillata NRRL 6337]